MAQCKNGTKNERSYGRHERFPCLMTRRLDFGQLIVGMGLPTSECSASALLVLLVQQGCGFQRTLLDDHGVLLLSLLEWWRVPRRMNNHRSSSDESFDRERRGTIVYDAPWKKALTQNTHCLALVTPSVRNPQIQNKPIQLMNAKFTVLYTIADARW
jgi:hypothetical protein